MFRADVTDGPSSKMIPDMKFRDTVGDDKRKQNINNLEVEQLKWNIFATQDVMTYIKDRPMPYLHKINHILLVFLLPKLRVKVINIEENRKCYSNCSYNFQPQFKLEINYPQERAPPRNLLHGCSKVRKITFN